MILSEIIEIKNSENLTKSNIEKVLKKKFSKIIKWAIVDFSEDFFKILVSFEKFLKKSL